MTLRSPVVGPPGRPLWRIALPVVIAVHFLALYAPRVPDPAPGLPVDKVGHVLIFAMVLYTAGRAGAPVRGVAVLLAAHAVISEVYQSMFLPHRTGDWRDSVADLAGIALAGWLLRHPADGRRARPG